MASNSGQNPLPMAGPLEAPPDQGFLGATLGIAGKHAAYAFEKPGGLRDQLSYLAGAGQKAVKGMSDDYSKKIQNTSDDIVSKFYGDDLKETSLMDKWIGLNEEATPKWNGPKKGVGNS